MLDAIAQRYRETRDQENAAFLAKLLCLTLLPFVVLIAATIALLLFTGAIT